ncbi:MAG: PHP domain-containing protein [Oligoflexia bacterium]|nr:PHP domain-containing protein [Oligoflexia bacterium]
MTTKNETSGIEKLMQLPSLGQKKAQLVFDIFDITSLSELDLACRQKRLGSLEGFSDQLQDKLIEEISEIKKREAINLISDATHEGNLLLSYIKNIKSVKKADIVGQLRRKAEVINYLSIIVNTADIDSLKNEIEKYPNFENFVSSNDTQIEITLKNEIHCSIASVSEQDYVYKMFISTGSNEYIESLKKVALNKGFSFKNEGLYQGDKKVTLSSEEDIYKALGLNYIFPERREIFEINTGVQPPLLVKEKIKGIFHCHTQFSDGVNTLEEMVSAAQALGLEYIGISEHSASSEKLSNGLKKSRVLEQFKIIEVLQKKYKIKIFKGIESDILIDGKLDYDDSILKKFDFVIGSVHAQFDLDKNTMTKRVQKALNNPYLDILGHPTGRMMPHMPAYKIDLNLIVTEAAKLGVVVELNAAPKRLDLDWRVLPLIKMLNSKVSINPDAHSVAALEDYEWGIHIANKASLEEKHIVNMLPANLVLKTFKRHQA